MLAPRSRRGSKKRFGLGPSLLEQIAVAVTVESVGIGPVAIGGENVGIAFVLPEFEVMAARKGADLVSRGIEDFQEIAERIGVKRHADETNKHSAGGLREWETESTKITRTDTAAKALRLF